MAQTFDQDTLKAFAETAEVDIETSRGSVLFPYRPELVVRTDLEARTILINDTLGLIDASFDGE